jgi:glucose/arabinose dehydrogenase
LIVAALVGASCGGKSDKVSTKKRTTTSESSTSTTVADTSTSTGGATTAAPPRPATTRPPATTGGTAAPAPGGPPVAIKLTRVASLSQPLAFAQAPGDDAMYVAEQGGRVRAVRNGQVSTVIDVSGQITSGGEQGLLGLTFVGGSMVINYTDRSGDTHVDSYPFANGHVTGGARQLLFVDQPYANHNGGNVITGPDGHLYVGMGDGGSGGDPQNHAQNPNDRLGKMLRIDPSSGAVDIWMIGLRNPWRFSFDRTTGDMWIGDVGQNAWEEVDFAAAGSHGQNWGWRNREGKHAYNNYPPIPGAVDPIYDYGHAGEVCAVTGGYVYRGARLGGWGGTYLFADECVGKVMALTRSGSNVNVRDTGLHADQLASFGEDHSGELYVLSLSGGVYRIDPA